MNFAFLKTCKLFRKNKILKVYFCLECQFLIGKKSLSQFPEVYISNGTKSSLFYVFMGILLNCIMLSWSNIIVFPVENKILESCCFNPPAKTLCPKHQTSLRGHETDFLTANNPADPKPCSSALMRTLCCGWIISDVLFTDVCWHLPPAGVFVFRPQL